MDSTATSFSPACTSSRTVLSHRSAISSQNRPNFRVRATPGQGRVDKGLGVLEWTGKLIPQGLLVKGVKTGWRTAWELMMKELAPQSSDGDYTRPSYGYIHSIGTPEFPEETNRYVLYVGNPCPWCHRVVLTLVLRGLTRHISIVNAVDDPERASRGGWVFNSPEPVFGCNDLREVYDAAEPGYRGRCTAPLLVDCKARRIVSNESSHLVKMLNDVHLPGCSDVDLYPAALRGEIDSLADAIYDKVNNGVYKSGFATSQAAYERAQKDLWSWLDLLEGKLGENRFLTGSRFTLADLQLFPTIVRFDAMYATLFKCSRKRIQDYPNLQGWLRDVYQFQTNPDGMQVCDTINIDDARRSYFGSLFPLNAGGIVPTGPTLADLRLDTDHQRGSIKHSDIFHIAASTAPSLA
ncbi:hypothetical protein WJX84_005861 [Apatococcus fuscideae]|uniref:GST C-terminal domain-containing protein n=1 Tax=Apatococcus fuscideae TaxID=2026836 RepID=A0AAW1TIJ6_9CHLO